MIVDDKVVSAEHKEDSDRMRKMWAAKRNGFAESLVNRRNEGADRETLDNYIKHLAYTHIAARLGYSDDLPLRIRPADVDQAVERVVKTFEGKSDENLIKTLDDLAVIAVVANFEKQ